jgi:hypothetical protein
MSDKKLIIDPTPAGWAFGFPKALPDEAVGGSGNDLWIKPEFDLTKWVVEQGYPEANFQYYRTWVEPKDPGHPEYDPDIHGGGVEYFR